MISKFLKNFDIFAQPFQFNSAKQSQRKRTCIGGFLSISIVIVTLTYFFYLTYGYSNNQMPPKYRSQSFVTNDNINISMHNDLFAFQFTQFQGNRTLDDLQAQKNKTYLTFVALFIEKTSTTFNVSQIDFIQCQNPQLNGFKCLDMSKLPNKYITTGNINQIYSDITIFVYRCQDIDQFKQTVPDNCASPEEISDYLTDVNNMLSLKLYTSQYNTTSKSIQTSFKNQNILISKNQKMLTELRAQKHTTTVKDGPLIQNEYEYTSPISFIVNSQVLGSYVNDISQPLPFNNIIEIIYSVDETVQYIGIQYPTYPEVLALCNSTLALLMCLGFFGRQMAQQIIKQELFMLTLQNIYKGTFQKILKVNNLQVYDDIIQLEGLSESYQTQTQNSDEHQGQIFVPSIIAKQQQLILSSNTRIKYDDKQQDEVKESIISEIYSTEQSPKSKIITNQNFNIEKSTVQPQIGKKQRKRYRSPEDNNKIFKNNQTDYQSISKGIILSNSQTSKLQNMEVKSKLDDLPKKQNLLDCINSRIDNQNLSKKIENKLFNFKLFNKKKHLEMKGLNKITIQSIKNQVANSLDFVSFYKDMLLVKKAIMILLSNEQLAALELVGITDMYFQDNIDKNDYKKNYFEEQFEISQSDELKSKYIESFIKKCQNIQNLSSTDQRIFSSLI
ncbi:transmembrane protein, putative (macronuclear) [Tetrahymena thermophila SB210]|uniref:Transmembrane protein, putative n=1 Tax=Tetrahymena thermophila (strain SB210) TaxID=312017 RepID=Q24C78_TETTS|nr:transmembrane protein, putative [Tetrahymena thermophila SB210]EAS05360.2 transmembrane protein, putative [Tetrahymena thermophila SB210]|eukprot:XP_001025605.2 transmembrane protein, putative [Tetrahymena thermophila SB210]